MFAYVKKPGHTPHIRRYILPVAIGDNFTEEDAKAYAEIAKECPLPLATIPNVMGINLCAVESIEWSVGPTGGLIDLKINFNTTCEAMVKEEFVKDRRDYWKACLTKNVNMSCKEQMEYIRRRDEVEGRDDEEEDDCSEDCMSCDGPCAIPVVIGCHVVHPDDDKK